MAPKIFNTDARSETFDEQDYRNLRRSSVVNAVVSSERYDSEDDASVFFARELDYVKSRSYDKLYPDFNALALFPVSSEADPGAQAITYYSFEKTGAAKIINDYADDLPRVDVTGEPTTRPLKSVGAAYGYSVDEMRASRYSGKSLEVRRAESSRYAIDKITNEVAWAGDEESGLEGILSPTNNIPVFVLPNGASGSPKWINKTADEILADVNAMTMYQSSITNGLEKSDTLALPQDIYIHICNKRVNETDTTVKKFLLDNAPFLKDIVDVTELSGTSGSTNPYAPLNVAVLFKANDPDKLTIELSLPYTQYPLQEKGLGIEINCEAKTAGVIVYYPYSVIITPGI